MRRSDKSQDAADWIREKQIKKGGCITSSTEVGNLGMWHLTMPETDHHFEC